MTLNPAPSESPDAAADAAALDWLVRRKDRPDPATEAAFRAWLAASPGHAQAYARWDADWSMLDAVPDSARAALRTLDAAPAQSGAPAASRAAGSPPAPRRRPGWRLATAALAVCAALLWTVFALLPAAPQYRAQYATAPGEQQEIRLPDGSRLILDSSTRVEIAFYPKRREVTMAEGQAMFEVQPDAVRPFDVVSDQVRVTVVGTRFNVRHTPSVPGYAGLQVEVAAGHVRVAPEHPAGWWQFWLPDSRRYRADLIAGQRLAVSAAGVPGRVTPIDAAAVAPWLDHRLAFDNATLAQVLAEFGRYGHPAPALSDPGVAALRLTGTFDSRNPAGFYRVLPQALPVRVDTRNDPPTLEPAR